MKGVHPFGVFVEIMPGLDGLVHVSELAPKRVVNVESFLKSGDKIAQGMGVDSEAVREQYAKYKEDIARYKELEKEYSRVYFFCGSDHKDNFQSFFDRYNGVEFSFGIIRAVTVERTSKKESGTYIRSIVDKLSFYWYVPGSIKAIHQYKKDLKEALDYFSSIQTKKR